MATNRAFSGLLSANPTSQSVAPMTNPRAVVVHGGARDAYQLSIALSDAGLLEALVTDLFWSECSYAGRMLRRFLPGRLIAILRKRSAPEIPASRVRTVVRAGLGGFIDRLPWLPFGIRRWIARSSDGALGRIAGAKAKAAAVGLVSYSYFGYDAFKAYGRGGVLFQAHPHPFTMRKILRQELLDHPDCNDSLSKEWELALPEQDFQHLVSETAMASHYLAASSFTRDSLIENGIHRARIAVVPYGVDCARFRPANGGRKIGTKQLRLLFVGRINQRKGIKYLVEALRLLPHHGIELTICGRVVDDLSILRSVKQRITLRPNVSAAGLVSAYQSADLFVFPSVAEGFGQVLLESLASGLPILSTSSTAAPDLIEEGVEGFVVEPRRPDLLAAQIEWALGHRDHLAEMSIHARRRAETFTWKRFRASAAKAVESFLLESSLLSKREVA